jgi:energy-coupling factor transporter ATP-binding protein EcfA2
MLVSLAAILRQLAGMLRARTSRGSGRSPWAHVVLAPIETPRGFGRITAALFLRAIERAEGLERARRARGDGSVVTAATHAVAVELTARGYHYPDGIPALAEIHLAIPAGERVAILGPNGAGKTTLLLHLAGLLPERQPYLHRHAHSDEPHRHEAAPRVVVDGVAVSSANVGKVRERVGIVFQDPDEQLIGLTVEEDVAFGPRARKWSDSAVASAVTEALAAVGLSGFESRLPHHLSAGREAARLSGRGPGLPAGIAAPRRAVVWTRSPRAARARRPLAGFTATQVIASHDLTLVAGLCGRAVVMDRGAIVAQGPTEELLSNRELLRSHGLD